MKNKLKLDKKTAKNDMESIFEELARRVENLNPREKMMIIAQVEVDKRPPYKLFDMNGNGYYPSSEGPLLWEEYAQKKIKALERNKSNHLYQ